jgi:Mrp family chromosome partitioning ATPase
VSNSPAYPKKLPIVLIATLATLMLATGTIVTGELLRMTIPHAAAAFGSASASAPVRVPASGGFATSAERMPASDSFAAPIAPDIESEFDEVEQLAGQLLAAGAAARKVTILGTASSQSITQTALTIARLIARSAKVIVVDLTATSPTISAVSVDPNAPGLAELMQGEASFTQVITKDRLSRAQLVSSGRPGSDRTLLQSPRLGLAIDALLNVYDHVLLDAGSAADLPAEILTSQARAVVVPDAAMAADARNLMCEQLKAVGFSEVTMLSRPALPSDAVDPAPRVVAA